MSHMMQPRVVLVKKGTDTSQGIPQLIANINACRAVFDILKTTLGPKGMDKLISDSKGVTVSNDGATIIKKLDIVHPAASTLVDIARSQDAEVGDGTTSVVLLASQFLDGIKQYVEDGVHAQLIIKAFRKALSVAQEKLRHLAVDVSADDEVKQRDMLVTCAETALNSKLISGHMGFFGNMVVDAVLHLDESLDLNMVGMKKVGGGSVTDSRLVHGVAFRKTFSYAGFEQQPKSFKNVTIAALNVELELKSEGAAVDIRLDSTEEYAKIVDAEWNIIYAKLDKIYASGAKIVLSRKPIGDLATQWFADRDVFCAGRVDAGDMGRLCKATGAVVQTSLNDLSPDVLGSCGIFREEQIGAERFNIFEDCPKARTASLILRGSAGQFIEETERSLHDALCVVRRQVKHHRVVGGGGAIEMELSRYLREYSKTIQSKEQLIIMAYAQALEIIPRQLCNNAGFDATDVLNDLRAKHATGHRWYGVDIDNGGTCDTFEKKVWEPSVLKMNALASATEAACLILSVDETVRNPKSQAHADNRPVRP